MEWHYQSRSHSCALLTNQFFEVKDLGVPLCASKSSALDEIREMSRLSELIDKAVTLLGIFLETELIKVKAVTRASDLLWLFARVF